MLLAALVVQSAPGGGVVSAHPGHGDDDHSGFHPVTPTRVLDTRRAISFRPGEERVVPLGLPVGAVGAVVNLTVTGGTADTFVSVRPAGARPAETSNLNVPAGVTRANGVVTGVDAGGSVIVSNAFGTIDVIIDVNGWFSDGFVPVDPVRSLDSRRTGSFGPGESRRVPLDVPLDLGVVAVALNVTVVAPTDWTFLTVWSGDTDVPDASNLNALPGETWANVVVTSLAADGSIAVSNAFGTADVLVDVMGWFTVDVGAALFEPVRAVDTRRGDCGGMFSPGETRQIRLFASGSAASAAMLNVTLVSPTTETFLTIWPSADPMPEASSLNASGRSGAVPNGVVVGVSDGAVSVHNAFGWAHVLVDVVGYVEGESSGSVPFACDATIGGAAGGSSTTNPPVIPPVIPPSPTTASWDEHGLVIAGEESRRVLGVKRFAVMACRSPQSGSASLDLEALVTWLSGEPAEYFIDVSGGAFTPVFEAVGMIDTVEESGSACLQSAQVRRPEGFDGVFVTDVYVAESRAAGLGGSWGVWVDGGCIADGIACLAVVVHEIGHAIGWPHSWHPFEDLEGALWTEYTNPYDIMSSDYVAITAHRQQYTYEEREQRWSCDEDGRCSWGGWRPHHTMAFNRYVSGWIDAGSVVVHETGSTSARLMAPGRGGSQMLAVPTEEAGLLLTLEARPSIGRDRMFFGDGGVAVHLVDQRSEACGFTSGGCPGLWRRQGPAVPNVFRGTELVEGFVSYMGVIVGINTAHVVEVGDSLTVGDVTVTVTSAVDGGFEVTVTGAPDTVALAGVMPRR